MQRAAVLSTLPRTRVRWGAVSVMMVIAVGGLLVLSQALLLYSHPLLYAGVGQDTVDFYVGALAVRHGLNPYAVDIYLGQQLTGIPYRVHPFAYTRPPAVTLVSVPLTWLSVGTVYRVLCLANVVAVALTALCILRAAGVALGRRAGLIILVALASGAGFLASWYGQETPLLALVAAAALLLSTRGHAGWAGALATVTLAKPQLSLLALLVAFGMGGGRLRRGMALGALGFAVLSLLAVGPAGCLSFATILLDGVTHGGRERTHDPDSLALDGAYYQLFAGPFATAMLVATVLAVGIVGLVLLRRLRDRRLARPQRQVALAALLLLNSLILPYSHQYDSSVLLLPYILAVINLPPGALRRYVLALALAAALAPYLNILHQVTGVRLLPFIDLGAAALLCAYGLSQRRLPPTEIASAAGAQEDAAAAPRGAAEARQRLGTAGTPQEADGALQGAAGRQAAGRVHVAPR